MPEHQRFKDERNDLEMIARIACTSKYSARFHEDELDEEEMKSLERLKNYKLVSEKIINRGEQVILTYTFTPRGKRAYSDILDGFQKSLPDYPKE